MDSLIASKTGGAHDGRDDGCARHTAWQPPGFEEYGPANSAALCRELLEDIIPLVENSYKVNARPRARAFAGLSMGGHHALTVALNHHDQFNWIGAFSSAPPPTNSVPAGVQQPRGGEPGFEIVLDRLREKDFLYQRNR